MNLNWESWEVLSWNFPVIPVVGVALAIYVAGWLMRQGRDPGPPAFECDVCGRRQGGFLAKAWRYCPWCGTPRRSFK